MKNRIWWRFSIEEEFSTAAGGLTKQDWNSRCGTVKIMLKILAVCFICSGGKNAPHKVCSLHESLLHYMTMSTGTPNHEDVLFLFLGLNEHPVPYSNHGTESLNNLEGIRYDCDIYDKLHSSRAQSKGRGSATAAKTHSRQRESMLALREGLYLPKHSPPSPVHSYQRETVRLLTLWKELVPA